MICNRPRSSRLLVHAGRTSAEKSAINSFSGGVAQKTTEKVYTRTQPYLLGVCRNYNSFCLCPRPWCHMFVQIVVHTNMCTTHEYKCYRQGTWNLKNVWNILQQGGVEPRYMTESRIMSEWLPPVFIFLQLRSHVLSKFSFSFDLTRRA